ncbi:hypothetical protein TNCV_1222951 [Trichonephila clavipes]|nr:hypothetical protein TNCV_1222951 [Trichonephila clavipes]
MFKGILRHSSWRYYESSGKGDGGGYRFRIERFKEHKGEHSGGGQRPSISLSLPPTTREDLRLDSYLEYLHAAKALYIAPMSSPGFVPSPYGTAASVANHYTDGRLKKHNASIVLSLSPERDFVQKLSADDNALMSCMLGGIVRNAR